MQYFGTDWAWRSSSPLYGLKAPGYGTLVLWIQTKCHQALLKHQYKKMKILSNLPDGFHNHRTVQFVSLFYNLREEYIQDSTLAAD